MPGWHSASSVCSPQAGGGNCFLGVQRPSCAFRGIWLVGRSLGYCGRHWLGLPPAPSGCDVSAAQHLPSWQESPSWSGIDCVCEISLLSLHMKGEMFRSSASFSNISFTFLFFVTTLPETLLLLLGILRHWWSTRNNRLIIQLEI